MEKKEVGFTVRFLDKDGNIKREYTVQGKEEAAAFFGELKKHGPFSPPEVRRFYS